MIRQDQGTLDTQGDWDTSLPTFGGPDPSDGRAISTNRYNEAMRQALNQQPRQEPARSWIAPLCIAVIILSTLLI